MGLMCLGEAWIFIGLIQEIVIVSTLTTSPNQRVCHGSMYQRVILHRIVVLLIEEEAAA